MYTLSPYFKILICLVLFACASNTENPSDTETSEPILLNPTPYTPNEYDTDTNESSTQSHEEYQGHRCISDVNSPDYVAEACDYTCPGQASIQGLACSPNGTPIIDAQVIVEMIDCRGNTKTYEVKTDERGYYMISDVVIGEGVVKVIAGSFSKESQIQLQDGELLDLSTQEICFEADTTRIAVIEGDYDSIEDSLSQLGFEYDLYCSHMDNSYGARSLLGNPQKLAQYDILFLNCGAHLNFETPEGQEMARNLKAFVAGGGSLYASDLMAGAIQAIWPEKVEFGVQFDPHAQNSDPCCTCTNNCPAYCGADPDATSSNLWMNMCMGHMEYDQSFCFNSWSYLGWGLEGVYDSQVMNSSLQNRLGKSNLSLHFDLAEWVEILYADHQVEILVQAGLPMMVRFQEQQGRVIYTSFHNEAQASQDVQKILQAIVFEL